MGLSPTILPPPVGRALRTLAALALLGALNCATSSSLSRPERKTVAEQYLDHTFELRHTSVIGQLYDDNERELLSPYPFEDIYHRVDLFGAPMRPAHPRALVPAGTRVTIRAIDYPAWHSFIWRMPATPHGAIWAQLEVQPEHPDRRAPERPPLILPLDVQVQSVAMVDTAMNRYLAPEGEVTGWLSGRSPAVQVAISHKEVLVGMHVEEMEASLGPAWRWFMDALPEGKTMRVAWYPHHEIWLLDHAVTAIRPSRFVP